MYVTREFHEHGSSKSTAVLRQMSSLLVSPLFASVRDANEDITTVSPAGYEAVGFRMYVFTVDSIECAGRPRRSVLTILVGAVARVD